MNDVVIVGAGGHGRVIADAARAAGMRVLGFTDRDVSRRGTRVDGVEVLGDDDALAGFDPRGVQLLNGVGSVGDVTVRRRVHDRLVAGGWTVATVVHPRAILAMGVTLGPGVQVMAGAVLQPGTQLGTGTLVNTGAIVDHDCRVGAHCHVAPGACLSGGVTLGDNCHVGSGATVIQGVTLGADCLVAAGAVVVSDHVAGRKLIGVPARPEPRA